MKSAPLVTSKEMTSLPRGAAIASATIVWAAGACSRDGATPSRSASHETSPPGVPIFHQVSSPGVSTRMDPSDAALLAKADAGPASWHTDPVFSAPIGAVRNGGSTVVAGLVTSAGVLRAVGFRPDGSSWTRDVLTGLTADPDAEVKLDRAGEDGVAIVWKGKAVAGRSKIAILGIAGDMRAEAQDIGTEWCTTADGVAWVESRPHGVARAQWRSWGDAGPRDIASIAAGRTPAVVCGDHDVFTLGDGDDDLTASFFAPNDATARPASVILRGADFDDDEVEHRVFTVADRLQVARLAESGALSMREVPAAGPPHAWRAIKHRMVENEDLVAVDGDSAATVVVSTRAREDECPNAESSPEEVDVLRIDRATGAETVAGVAPADCARSYGPFWIARLGTRSPIVAWVEQRAETGPGAPPIRGLAYAVLRDAKHPDTGRFDIDSHALVDAGCDDAGCFAAALVGSAAQDAGAPSAAPIVVFGYP